MDLAKILDRYYIPTGYPNGFESGPPWTITLERTLRRRWIMPEKSSIYARHLYRSRRALLRELKKAAEKLKEKHPEVLGVILFGSIARGDYGLKSDADVLLILRESSHERFFDRIPEYQMEAPIPVDVFPYTLNEIEEMKRKGNTLIKRALKEGIPL